MSCLASQQGRHCRAHSHDRGRIVKRGRTHGTRSKVEYLAQVSSGSNTDMLILGLDGCEGQI